MDRQTLACCLEDVEHALSLREKTAGSPVGYLSAAARDYMRSTYDAVTRQRADLKGDPAELARLDHMLRVLGAFLDDNDPATGNGGS